MLNQELYGDKDLGLINRQYKRCKNKIKIDNCKILNLKLYKARESGFRNSQYRKLTNKIIKKQKLTTILPRDKNLKNKIKKFISENNSPMKEMLKVSLPHIWLNRNLENKVSKLIFVKNLEKLEKQIKNFCPDKNKTNLEPTISKNRKSNRTQEKIFNLYITFAKMQKSRTRRKSGFVSNKIRTFTYISYKHETHKKSDLKRNCFRKINSILTRGAPAMRVLDLAKTAGGASSS